MVFWRAKRILIIEDNKDLVLFVAKILESAHFTVFSLFHGAGAVDMAVSKKPDVIILDMMLPDIGGGEIEGLLKQDPATRKIPIIFMTALVSKEDEESAISQANSRLLLSKPVTKERLLKLIHIALSRR